MFGKLLNRWGKDTGAAKDSQPPLESVASRPTQPASTVTRTSSSIPMAPTQSTSPWRLVRRDPLIDQQGWIRGWNLHLSTTAAERLSRPAAPRVLHEAYWFALAQAARSVAAAKRFSVLLAPPPALVDDNFLAQLPSGLMLNLDFPDPSLSAVDILEIADHLRLRNQQIAAVASKVPLQQDELRILDAAKGRGASVLEQLALEARREAGSIVLNLESTEDVIAALQAGATFCCGSYTRCRRQTQRHHVPASLSRVANVLMALATGQSVPDVVQLVGADAVLSERLIRLAQSPAFAFGRPIESVDQAASVLGARDLYRALCILLITAENVSPIAPALQETAIARGRLMELLAIARGRRDPPDGLFLTGAFSLLQVLLDVPLEVVLARIPLPGPASDAIFAEEGPWRPYLDVALAIEADDLAGLESACGRLELDVDGATSLAVEADNWALLAINASHQAERP